ncbi:uncharacterized protein LOC105735382 [Apis florea]|uniref:uncharacterized protein LOC105735382 n=1 Tax=Apis florea TaxID=7463 RepID=UPI0012FF4731|nr:uncharacterized protein LOC105735382 [Apis florea]
MERNDDGTASIDCKMEEANNLESTNVDEDCLEEKKEIFVNESRLLPPSSSSSSSANTTDCKTTSNRIVVSNAQISNNSVTVSVIYPENNNAYLPTSTVEGTLEVHSKCGGTMSARRTDSEECDSFECNANDEKQIGEFPKEDFVATESDENEGSAVKARNSGPRNDRFESRGYVFLTDYRNRLKHRLLLQQLETEEKRLKIKIAEMAIQEVQLRIKALSEDMRRTEELHRLHLVRAAAGDASVRVGEFPNNS